MSFPNITLLECNRMQSNQKGSEGDDNAVFTNKMGRVVELDVGDTIEVKSAFINKRGCANPNSIEFKGKTLGVSVKFEETQTATETPTTYVANDRYPEIYFYSDITSNLQVGEFLNDPTNPVPQENNVRQGGLAFRQIYNTEVEKDLVDNEAHLETNFYKNANGENTCMLPRNYFRERLETTYEATTDSPYRQYVESYFNRCNFDVDVIPSAVAGSLFYKKGSISGISEYMPENSYYDGRGFMGMKSRQIYFNAFCPTDYRFFKQATTYKYNSADTTNVEPYEKEQKNTYSFTDNSAPHLRNSEDEFSEFRPKNDNSRFYLFEREYDWLVWPNTPQAEGGYTPPKVPNYTFIDSSNNKVLIDGERWFNYGLDGGANIDGFPQTFRRSRYRSPALFPYVKRSKLNKIQVDKGYSTPQSLAEQITIELQKEDEDSPFISNKKDLDYSTGIRTQFYEPSICADNNFNRTNYSAYFNSDGDTDLTEPAFKWWRNYHNILIKRPGLYEEGTKINTKFGFVGTPAQQLANEDPRDDDSGIGNYIQNSIDVKAPLGNNTTDSIETGWLYTENNLKMLSRLFDEQGKYPELFYDETKGLDHNGAFMNQKLSSDPDQHIEWGTPATIDNSRFLHINRFDLDITNIGSYDGGNVFNILGDDGFVRITTSKTVDGELRKFDTDHRSTAFFFKYDPQFRNINTGGQSTSRLSYGFATKVLKADGYEYIVLHPELVNGLRPDVFALRGGSPPYDNSSNDPLYEQPWDSGGIKGRDGGNNDYTMIGFDYHFTSWGQIFMLTTNGLKPSGYNYDETTQTATFGDQFFYNQGGGLILEQDLTTPENLIDSTIFISENYLGSNNIACKFDAVSNRFGFEFLHRPENEGNTYNAGSTDFINDAKTSDTAVPKQTFPVNPNATDEVLKINKRLFKSNWCADMVPYIEQDGEVDLKVHGTTRGRVDIKPMNINLDPWVIYDSRTGVSINFGKTALIEDNKYLSSQVSSWDNSLLGILGFSFDQFNPKTITSKNNSLARITNRNIRSVYNPSTNAQYLSTDTNLYRMNEYGANFMDTNLPTAIVVELLDSKSYNAEGHDPTKDTVEWLYLPPIVLPGVSVVIEAVNLPRVALFPYMTIRSDIMRPQKYIGGLNSGLSLPVCAVINRINAEKDFIQLEGSDVYTITEPMKFSSITTIITDPDGSLSLLDEGSAVIYKITKSDNISRYNIIEDFKKMLSEKK